MIGSTLSEDQLAEYAKIGEQKNGSTERAYTNFYAIHNSGHDPFGVMIDRAGKRDSKYLSRFVPTKFTTCRIPTV